MAVASYGLVRSDIASRSTQFGLLVNQTVLDALGADVHKRVQVSVSIATLELQASVQEIIREKNIIDTGNLLNSITSWTDLTGMLGTVNVGAFYGIYIEFGTVKKQARPFVAPAVEAIGPRFILLVTQAVQQQ